MGGDEEDHVLGRPLVEPEPGAHPRGHPRPPLGVAAPVALADVVEQHPEVERGRVLDLVEDAAERPHRGLRARGHLVDRLDRAQRVLVHRVAVEEVVLDEEAHPAELRQEAAQEPRLVHGAQGEPDAPAPAQDVDEDGRGLLRLAQLAAHEGEALADREGELVGERHTLGLGGGEGGEEPVAAGEQGLRLGTEPAVAHLEVAGGAALREGGEEAAGGLLGRAPQDAAEDTVQVGGAPVVVAHEQLRGEQAPAVLVAEATSPPRAAGPG